MKTSIPRMSFSLIFVLSILPIQAGVVTSTNDMGADSLRQAIVDASPGDIITFDSALDGQTITLGGTQLLIDQNLTIDASSLTNGITINANGAVTNNRVMEIALGTNVTLDSLTITGGHAPDGHYQNGDGGRGGGILNAGTLALINCTLSGNSAGDGVEAVDENGWGIAGDGGAGGGICNSGTLTLTNSTLSGNAAGDGMGMGGHPGNGGNGGGIENSGSLIIINSSISGNHAGDGGWSESPGAGGSGGGIWNSGTLSLTNSSLIGNHSGRGYANETGYGGGGGIYTKSSFNVTITKSTLSGNFTSDGEEGWSNGYLADASGGGCGGGIYAVGTITLTDSTLSGNYTGDGGISYGGTGGKGGSGGGIYANGTITLINSTLYGNATGSGGEAYEGDGGGDGGDGGGISNTGTLTLTHATLSGNSTGGGGLSDLGNEGIGGIGGGIYNSTTLTLDNSLIAGNTTLGAGADIYASASTTFTTYGANLVSIASGFSVDSGPLPLVTDNPLLAPLGDHGGPTNTMPPLPGSPAIDAAGPTSLTTDQRGMPRVADGNGSGTAIADIGAVETLQGADLNGFDFTGYDLTNINLSAATLTGANLSTNDLSTTYLNGARYNLSTQFPPGFDLSGSSLVGLLTQAELATLHAASVATGEDNVTSDPTSFGLYDESNIHNLAFGQPLLSRDAGTGKVTLNFQIQQSPDLATPWAPVPTITPTFNGITKEIEAVFDPPPGSAYFFRLYGSDKAAPPP